MTHPNLQTIERLYANFAAGDIEAMTTDWTKDVVWHESGQHALAGTYEGPEQILAFFGQIFERTGGTFKAVLEHTLADDETGYSLHTASAVRNDRSYEALDVLMYRFQHGRIAEVWLFPHDQATENELFA